MNRRWALVVVGVTLPSLFATAPAKGLASAFGGGRVHLGVPELETMVVPPVAAPTPSEARSLSELARGDGSYETLLAVALDVSGVVRQQRRRHLEALAGADLQRLRERLAGVTDPARKGALLLKLLHQAVFRRYASEQTYPAVVLESGVYDCVSSAILYNVFAAGLGLETEGMKLPSHAYSALLAGRRYEVQTTVPDGFDKKLSGSALETFLRERHLTGRLGAIGRPISNAQLFALVIENRMSMHHDGPMPAGGPRREPALRVQRLLTERLTLLVPGDRRYQRNWVAANQQLAGWLKGSRPAEAFALTEVALKAAAKTRSRSIVEAARMNVIAFTHASMRASFAGGKPEQAAAVERRAEELLGCPKASECAELWSMARPEGWSAAKARLDAGDAAGAWRIVQLVPRPLTDPQDRMNLVFFATHEAMGRFARGDRAGAEKLVSTALSLLRCASGGPACANIADWMSGRWFDLDPPRAVAWARRAYLFDRASANARQNYVAATHDLLNALLKRSACRDAMAAVDGLRADGIEDAPAQNAVRQCR